MEGVEGCEAARGQGADPGRHQPCHQRGGTSRARRRAHHPLRAAPRARERVGGNGLRLRARTVLPAGPPLDHVGEARSAGGGRAACQQRIVDLRLGPPPFSPFFDSIRSTLKRPAPVTNNTKVPPKSARFLRKLLYWAITWAAGYSQ